MDNDTEKNQTMVSIMMYQGERARYRVSAPRDCVGARFKLLYRRAQLLKCPADACSLHMYAPLSQISLDEGNSAIGKQQPCFFHVLTKSLIINLIQSLARLDGTGIAYLSEFTRWLPRIPYTDHNDLLPHQRSRNAELFCDESIGYSRFIDKHIQAILC